VLLFIPWHFAHNSYVFIHVLLSELMMSVNREKVNGFGKLESRFMCMQHMKKKINFQFILHLLVTL
jgi:hypothetical protein